MKRIRLIKRALIIAAGALALAGCSSATQTAGSNHDNDDTVRIGGLFALSGGTAAYGTSENDAVKLAIQERNDAGGIDGKPIEYEVYDNKGNPQESASGATYLMDQKHVSVIMGPDTAPNSAAAIPVIQDGKTPMVSPTTTVDGATQDENGNTYDYFFRTCFQISFQGGAIAELANQKGYKTAAILKDNSTDYGQNLSNVFHDVFQGETVVEESYVSGDTDFTAVLTNIKQQNPDVIFIAGFYQEAGPIIKQAREMGITTPIYGPNGLGNQELINLAGKENMNDIHYVAHFVYTDDSPQEVKDFVKNYKEVSGGREPDMFSALAYDATNMVMDAIDRADSTDPQKVRDAIADTKDFPGLCYNITFDDQHNVKAPAYIVEVQNGELTDNVERIDEVHTKN